MLQIVVDALPVVAVPLSVEKAYNITNAVIIMNDNASKRVDEFLILLNISSFCNNAIIFGLVKSG